LWVKPKIVDQTVFFGEKNTRWAYRPKKIFSRQMGLPAWKNR